MEDIAERLKQIISEVCQEHRAEVIQLEVMADYVHVLVECDPQVENPRHLRQAEQKLKKLQEALSRKKRGSKRRRQAAGRVGKAYRRIRSQRKDFHHKKARK